MQLTDRQERIWKFIQEKHGDQRCKYTGALYTTHLWAVAELVSTYISYEPVITAALAHDLIEDTSCTGDEFMSELLAAGYPEFHAKMILNLVYDCTDIYTSEKYPRLNRENRKIKEAERLSSISPAAQSIKYADFMDNISSIAVYDPDFAEKYIQEKIRILDGMRKGNIHLLIGACAALAEAEKTIRYSQTH